MRIQTHSLEPYSPLPPSIGNVVRGTGIHQLPVRQLFGLKITVVKVQTDEGHPKNQEHVAQESAEESALNQGNVALGKVYQSWIPMLVFTTHIPQSNSSDDELYHVAHAGIHQSPDGVICLQAYLLGGEAKQRR